MSARGSAMLVLGVGPDGRAAAEIALSMMSVRLPVRASATAIVLRIASASLLPSCTVRMCLP